MAHDPSYLTINNIDDPAKSITISSDNNSLYKLLPPITTQTGNTSADDSTNSIIVDITDRTIAALNSNKIFIIDSTKSGNLQSSQFYSSILNPILTKLSINFTYLKTSSPTSIHDFANSILLSSLRNDNLLFLFLSGDTAISEFINTIYYRITQNSLQKISNLTILPFPHGTGNGLCNSINLSSDLFSIKALFQNNIHHLPLYSLSSNSKLKCSGILADDITYLNNNDKYFIVVASWGIHSALVYESDTPEMRTFGTSRFQMAAQKILQQHSLFKGKISINSKDYLSFDSSSNKWITSSHPKSISGFSDLSYFLVTGVSNFEKKYVISPNGNPDTDDLYSITIPHLQSPLDVMELLNQGYENGKLVNDPKVDYRHLDDSKTLELELSNEMSPLLSIICLDGTSWEVVGEKRKLKFSVVHQNVFHYMS